MPASTSSIPQKCILVSLSSSSSFYDAYISHYYRIPFLGVHVLFQLYATGSICRYPVPQRSETQGRSEEYLGHWIRSRKITRDRIVLASKVRLSLCACVSRIAIFLQFSKTTLAYILLFRLLFVDFAFVTFLLRM